MDRKGSLLQVFAHERPFSYVHYYLVPLLVLEGKRPSRPQNREILGLSEDVWMMAEKCWDSDPSVRPLIANILSFFETTSHRWVPPTSEAIANLDLSCPTIQKPSAREQTTTMSEGVSGDDQAGSGDWNVITSANEAWRSPPPPVISDEAEWLAAIPDLIGSVEATLLTSPHPHGPSCPNPSGCFSSHRRARVNTELY